MNEAFFIKLNDLYKFGTIKSYRTLEVLGQIKDETTLYKILNFV
jgi:hypothetical protein